MNKEFVPYEQALALKELGFDEPCFGFYGGLNPLGDRYYYTSSGYNRNSDIGNSKNFHCTRVLYQQAFRWFREKYGLFVAPSTISYEDGPYLWFFEINSTALPFGTDLDVTDDFETYEEAELACLIKLIELCQNKKK